MKFFYRVVTALFLISLTGCGHYHLGNPGIESLPFKKLYVKPVINESMVPQAQTLVTDQTIQLLKRAGVCTTQREAEADATLCIVLTNYDRHTSTTKLEDTAIASSFYVTLTACLTLTNNCTGETYFCQRPVEASIHAQADESLQRLIYQDMPVLTRDLSEKIRNVVISTW